jgi:hypothetical protein
MESSSKINEILPNDNFEKDAAKRRVPKLHVGHENCVIIKDIFMSTYKEIQEYIRNTYGRTIKTCWIAHVKELNGLNPRKEPNRLLQTKRRNLCPDTIRPIIEGAMRHFGMIE